MIIEKDINLPMVNIEFPVDLHSSVQQNQYINDQAVSQEQKQQQQLQQLLNNINFFIYFFFSLINKIYFNL